MKPNPGHVPLETSGPDDTIQNDIGKSTSLTHYIIAKLENLDQEISNIKDPEIQENMKNLVALKMGSDIKE